MHQNDEQCFLCCSDLRHFSKELIAEYDGEIRNPSVPALAPKHERAKCAKVQQFTAMINDYEIVFVMTYL